MRLKEILMRAMEEGIGVTVQIDPDPAAHAINITHIVETVIEQIFVPCSEDKDLQPVAYGVCATIISLALDLQLRSALLLLKARLAIRGIHHGD